MDNQPLIDERLSLTTAEGIRLHLLPTGLLPRAAAYAIDLLLRSLMLMVLGLLLLQLGATGWGLLLLTYFLVEWFYPVVFEILDQGRTPGKRLLKLRVINGNGTPVTAGSSLLRNLLRAADFFPLFYLTGVISLLLSKHHQRLGDLAADTLVIHEAPLPARSTISPASSKTNAAAPSLSQPTDWQPTLADRTLLLAYLERHSGLTAGRRRELAKLAFPELTDVQAEAQLLSVAHHIREAG